MKRKVTIDDAKLVASIRAGSQAAGGALYDRALPVVERTLRRTLGSRDRDREDLIQIVMIELIRSLPRFRGEGPLDAFIARVTAHTVFKHLRRRVTESRIFEACEVDETPALAELPERASILRGLCARVRVHLDALEPDKAWALLLHRVDGHSVQEIARMMGVSITAAQARLTRARRELLARVADDPALAGAV
ncbi:MAG: RNA polymerase sigma factor [Polyangiales bacterium]